MLLPIRYGYHVDAIPRRGRLVRHMAFLDETAIEIAEISASETEVRIDVKETGFHFNETGPSYAVVDHGGRLFRPVLTGQGTRPFNFALWREMRANGAPPDRENDVLGLTGLVDQPPPRGEETLHGRGLYHRWPELRIEQALLREVVADHRETDHARLQRNAERLLLIDGVLHTETSEPVWVANYFDRRIDVRGIDEHLRDRSSLFQRGHYPFKGYELFRLDRTDALDGSITGGRHVYAQNTAEVRLRGYEPGAADTAPMLRIMVDTARELVAWRRRVGPKIPDHPSNYVELMEGFPFPSREAGPYRHLRALEAIAERLEDLTGSTDDRESRVAAFMQCLEPALRRGRAEIGQGLIVEPAFAAEDDEALSGLAP